MGERMVEYETEGSIAVVRLNRPDRLNALNRQLQDELGEAFAAAEGAPEDRGLILTGTGPAFSVCSDTWALRRRAVRRISLARMTPSSRGSRCIAKPGMTPRVGSWILP